MSGYDCDFLVVGSGFGGAVSALRLAEKGLRVIVLQGRRIGPEQIAAGRRSLRDENFLRFHYGPLIDGERPAARARRTIASILAHPVRTLEVWGANDFVKRASVLVAMQQLDNGLAFRYGRLPIAPWRTGPRSVSVSGRRAPTYLPIANRATRAFATASGGKPLNMLIESVANKSSTAHTLGGAAIGASAAHGVIDSHHEVFGHPGMYVVDASAIPVNLGVNPSLTITALAERFASLIPAADGRDENNRGIRDDG